MAAAVWILLALLVACIVVQTVLVLMYVRALQTGAAAKNPDRSWQPPAMVVLCLRGLDPHLRDCLNALVGLDYPVYRVVCVLDHEQDPARQVLEEFETHERITIVVAGPPNGRCSLKCNSLIHAAKLVKENEEVIALVDADGVVDAHWLSDLIAPLRDDKFAASSGNRWYTPETRDAGTMVRYLWHVAASVLMYCLRIPWGGSLAIRTSFLHSAQLVDRWAELLFEDTPMLRMARRQQFRIALTPHVLVPNRERISLPRARRWIARQLLTIRLYHPAFGVTVLHCLATFVVILVAMVLLFVSLFTGPLLAAIVLTAGLLIYLVFYLIALRTIESTARLALGKRHSDLPPPARITPRLIGNIVLTQVVYLLATVDAFLCRSISWRGIRYRIAGPRAIQMDEYRPMKDVSPAAAASTESIED
ncbi:MAG: glycosyltransferase [Pirellulaceae bacterium]